MKKSYWILGLVGVFVVGLGAGGKGIGFFQSHKDYTRSAVEIWPTTGLPVDRDAKAEVVLYRQSIGPDNSYERMNWSAMNDAEPMYRFGVERGNGATDTHRPIWFCFERPEVERGLPAYCPLRIQPLGPDQGVWACDEQNLCTRVGG